MCRNHSLSWDLGSVKDVLIMGTFSTDKIWAHSIWNIISILSRADINLRNPVYKHDKIGLYYTLIKSQNDFIFFTFL